MDDTTGIWYKKYDTRRNQVSDEDHDSKKRNIRKIDTIVIHCSDTPPGMDIGAIDIRRWHIQERGWSDIGYHFVVKLDGTVQPGRPVGRVGAHVAGHNKHSIGICYVGGADCTDTRTDAQKYALRHLVDELKIKFNVTRVMGHRDFEGVDKCCPSFDAKSEYS